MWGFPERADHDGLPSPFRHERLSGFSRWSNSENKRQLLSLLTPNNYGRGLHVGHLLEPSCCMGHVPMQFRVAKINNSTEPWLFPSEVEWHSIMGPDNKPDPRIASLFDTIDYPCVGISYVNSSSAEYRWALDNVNYPDDFDGLYDIDANQCVAVFNDIPLIGIVPVWAVTPLHPDNQQMLKVAVNTIHQSYHVEMLNECYCTLDGLECEEECPHYIDYRNECECKIHEKALDSIVELYVQPIQVEKYMDPELLDIWEYAKEQNRLGWSVIDQAVHQGETWAYYWQQHQSPYPDFIGQNLEVPRGLIA